MVAENEHLTADVRDYWNSHTLGKQYVKDAGIEVGSPEFFAHIKPWMNPYKFPEIMPRIEREAGSLRGKHLLEVGCGMGFDGIEFMRRGVKVTATDLTPAAVDLARLNHEVHGVQAEEVRVANVLDLDFPDNTFDAVWACGVVHHTGNTELALAEVRRVLKKGGRAIVSHMYRYPSWMYFVSRFGRENIEFKEQDPPVTDFLTEKQALAMFEGYRVESTHRDHYRALPIARTGFKAGLYTLVFRPVYNLLPSPIAKRLAYKFSVIAVKE